MRTKKSTSPSHRIHLQVFCCPLYLGWFVAVLYRKVIEMAEKGNA